jgi:hypothetical protein
MNDIESLFSFIINRIIVLEALSEDCRLNYVFAQLL